MKPFGLKRWENMKVSKIIIYLNLSMANLKNGCLKNFILWGGEYILTRRKMLNEGVPLPLFLTLRKAIKASLALKWPSYDYLTVITIRYN